MRRLVVSMIACIAVFAQSGRAQSAADNIIVITLDGQRWQEVFHGADRDYFKRDSTGSGGMAEARYWLPTPEARRAALMPFLWSTMATRGQIIGDRSLASIVRLTNGLWFSYPGYNEMFSGVADPRIDANDKIPNPNLTVLEWLNTRPGFQGRVAAFGSWDVLPSILNTDRSHLPVGTGWRPVPAPTTDRERAINELALDLPPVWEYGPVDAPFVQAALEALRTKQPRVLYLMLEETDEWAHQGRYELYLDATHRADAFVQRIRETVQSMPAYADRTALLITTDHGRGASTTDWSKHGRDVPAADRTWIAMMGPGVPALGSRRAVAATTSQVAATIAALVGENFRAAVPAAAAPIDSGRNP